MNKYIVGLVLFGLLSCSNKEEEVKLFSLLPASQTGIDFRNELVSTEEMNILEYLYFYNGGGVAVGDVNNDGLVDIYFTSNQGENKLYLNKGDFRFEDITLAAGVTGDGGWSTGVTMADVNGDGLLDIYVCQVGDYKGLSGKNKLYINNGDLTFTEQGAEFGVDFVGFSTHALFFDYDQDGDLDLYLLNHSIKKPEVFTHADTKFSIQDEKGGDKLYKSMVSQGENRMVDTTEESGILSSSLGFGLGVGIGDVNGDGWLDIYVSNDFTEDDYLYINQADGTFKESLKDYISNTSRYSMGNDINDIDNDGLPDIFTTDMLPEDPEIWMKSIGEDKQEVYDIKKKFGYGDQYVRNHLQLNQGNQRFAEIGLLSNTFATDWSWSPLIFDMDNDGHKDIHITNGIVKRPNDLDFVQYSQSPNPNLTENEVQKRLIEMLPTMKLSNYAFRNEGDLGFGDMSRTWGLDQLSYSSGSAYADLNNDGALDLIVNNINDQAFIYQNNTSEITGNNFIQVDLKGDGNNEFGIGAEVTVYSGRGISHQLLSTSRGFQSGSSTTLTFGLGKRDKVDSLSVRWNATEREIFYGKEINERHTLEKGKGKSIVPDKIGKIEPYTLVELDIDWEHQENVEFDDMRREYLIPRKYSTEGPALAIGDVNNDGLEDFYLGGAKGQASALYLQQADGTFEPRENPIFEKLSPGEDVVAEFIDLNGNGYLDLYVGSGGNESPQGHFHNFDRVYLNDGKGNLHFSPNSLPPLGENTSSIALHDVNGDGAPDIFVTSAVVTGNYGAKPYSYLLINDGKGSFKDETVKYFGRDFQTGMLQKASWIDVDGDGKKELVMVGEWSPVLVFKQKNDLTFYPFPIGKNAAKAGLFNTVSSFGENGNQHLLLGNLGLNSKLKASSEKPLWLYHHDFDGNDQEDPLIFQYMGDRLVPFASRDDLMKQVPSVKKKHASYVDYAQIKHPGDLFDSKQLNDAAKYQVENLQSGLLKKNASSGYDFVPFPIEGQFAPIKDFFVWEKEGKTHILSVGGFYGFRNDLGRADAMPMACFIYENGQLKSEDLNLDFMKIRGEYRSLKPILIQGEIHILAVRNNGKPILLKVN
ncbi:VCBS repeat-containing protein [Belliella marina]|uniref:VCBS repeat-containing protein n=1 Tax=Belliella marina TaxID=1644146 RepID=A0ABW4VF17_9BACT